MTNVHSVMHQVEAITIFSSATFLVCRNLSFFGSTHPLGRKICSYGIELCLWRPSLPLLNLRLPQENPNV